MHSGRVDALERICCQLRLLAPCMDVISVPLHLPVETNPVCLLVSGHLSGLINSGHLSLGSLSDGPLVPFIDVFVRGQSTCERVKCPVIGPSRAYDPSALNFDFLFF